MKKEKTIPKIKPVLNARIGLEETDGQAWAVNNLNLGWNITAEVSRVIDEILAHPDQYTSPREVSVATLAA